MFIEKKLDKTRSFRMSMLAQKRIEKHFKKPFAKIDQDNLTVDDYAVMLHSCLLKEDREELKVNDLLEILDEYMNCKEVYDLFSEIIMDGFGMEQPNGKNEQGTTEEEQPAEIGTGKEPFETLS